MSLPEDPAAAVAELNCRYLHWLIGEIGNGRFWAATRETQLPPGCAAVLSAGSPPELDELLAEQERRRGRSSEPDGAGVRPIPIPWATPEEPFTTGDLS